MNSFLYNLDNIHLFIWIVIMLVVNRISETYREEVDGTNSVWRTKPLFAWLIFFPVLLMAVYGRPRSDTYLYISIYRSLPSDLSEGLNNVIREKEPGFALFQFLVHFFSHGNITIYRLAIALLHAIPIVTVLRRYSEDYLFSIFIFIAAGNHLAWMMNGLRQFIAVTIIFAATPWIIEKRYFKAVVTVLIATTFHRSAIFMLPVVFIVSGEAWNRRTLIFSFMIIGFTVLFARNITLFDEFADTVGYSMTAVREWGDDGAHPLRVLVAAIPMLLSFIARKEVREEETGLINICTNMSIITTGVTLVAMVTSGIMVGRMPIYTSLYNLILLPFIIYHHFHGKNSEFVRVMTIIFYFLYFIVLVGF